MSTNKKLKFKKNLFKLISKKSDLNIDNEIITKTVKRKLETEIVKRLTLINDYFCFIIYEDKIKIYNKKEYDNLKLDEYKTEHLKIIQYPKEKYKKYSKWFHEKYNEIEEIEEGIKKANILKLNINILKSIDSNFEDPTINNSLKNEKEFKDEYNELTEAEKILNGDVQDITSIELDEEDLDDIKLDEEDLDDIKLDEEDLDDEEIQELNENKKENTLDKEKIRIAYNRFKYLSIEKIDDFNSIDCEKLSEEEIISYEEVKSSLKTPEKVDIYIDSEELDDEDQWT